MMQLNHKIEKYIYIYWAEAQELHIYIYLGLSKLFLIYFYDMKEFFLHSVLFNKSLFS